MYDDDHQLLERFRDGDRQAFEILVKRYQDVIYRLALQTVFNKENAKDVVQEVFLRAWTRLRTWQSEGGKPFTWLYRTTKNICHEQNRSMDRINDSHEHSMNLQMVSSRANDSDLKDRRALLRRLVRDLPERQREVVWLHALEGFPQKHVAEILGIPLGTVKSNYHKALINLRGRLARMHSDMGSGFVKKGRVGS